MATDAAGERETEAVEARGSGRIHRALIVVGIAWAGIATVLSGLMTALVAFVALRVITGIGAGVFYSNVYKPSTGRRSWPCSATRSCSSPR